MPGKRARRAIPFVINYPGIGSHAGPPQQNCPLTKIALRPKHILHLTSSTIYRLGFGFEKNDNTPVAVVLQFLLLIE